MKPKTLIMKQKLVLLLFVVSTFLINAQTIESRINGANSNGSANENLPEMCYQNQIHEYLMENDPQYKQGREEAELMSEEILQNIDAIRAQRNTYTIPVVFHVIHEGEAVGQGTNISDAQLISCIDALNRDFAATAADGGIAQSNVPVAAGNTNIQFCLANKDPQGNPHSGINRVNGTSVAGYANQGITAAQNGGNELQVKGLSIWDNRYYLNVWVVTQIDGNGANAPNPNSFPGGTLGYAYLPQSNVSWMSDRDGIVVLNLAIGNDPNNNQGFRLWQAARLNRTMTHEVGHYLDLWHTFQGGSCTESNCNTQGDRCCDTPPHPQNNSWNACNSPNCSGTQQVENYMDYTGESCYEMFSNDQANRMIAALEGPRNAVWNTDNCGPTIVAEYDAGIVDILSPEGSLCASSFEPEVVIRNFGSQVLTSATIEYSWGTINNTFNWTGSLTQGSTANITLPLQNVSNTGNFTFTASTVNPNGQPDEDNSNNGSSSSFSIAGEGGKVSFVLELDCYGDETSWDIKDGQGQTIDSGSGYPTTATPDAVENEYCLADGCYTFTINDSFGDGLNGSSEAACNVDGDYWMTDADGNYLFEMTAPNGNFGSQAVHEFCVGGATPDPNDDDDDEDDNDDEDPTASIDEFDVNENVKLFPNPTSGAFTLSITGLNEEINVYVMDITGRVVITPETFYSNQQESIELDITEFGKGVYMVVFQNNNMKHTRRITLK